MPDISLAELTAVILSSNTIVLPFMLIVAVVKGWIVPQLAYVEMRNRIEGFQNDPWAACRRNLAVRLEPACCPYCGRYGDLGSCLGCGAANAPVRPQTRPLPNIPLRMVVK